MLGRGLVLGARAEKRTTRAIQSGAEAASCSEQSQAAAKGSRGHTSVLSALEAGTKRTMAAPPAWVRSVWQHGSG